MLPKSAHDELVVRAQPTSLLDDYKFYATSPMPAAFTYIGLCDGVNTEDDVERAIRKMSR